MSKKLVCISKILRSLCVEQDVNRLLKQAGVKQTTVSFLYYLFTQNKGSPRAGKNTMKNSACEDQTNLI